LSDGALAYTSGEVARSSTALARWRLSIRSTTAIAAVIAIVAACQPGPSGSAGTGSPGPPLSSSPSVGPSTAPSLALGWQRVTIQLPLDAPLTRVVWTGTRFLAVEGGGTLLDSIDGRTWHQQPRLGDGLVDQIAVGPGGVLAVGSVNVEGVVAIWHSTDGLDWSAVPDAASLHGTDGSFLTMAAVVAMGDGWLAVGGEHVNCTPGACGLTRAIVWTSPDGRQWTRGLDTAAMQHAAMNGVVRTASGYVAVGEAAADPSTPSSAIVPAVWTSPDGRAWTPSDQLPVVVAAPDADVALDGIAAAGSRAVAAGHATTEAGASADAFAWWNDGGGWTSVRVGQFVPSQEVRVAAVPGGWLAMFGFGSDAACSSAIWSSADGSSWSCIGSDPAFDSAAVSDAAVAPDIEVLVGSGPDGATVWTSDPH
jgi:hypothetical protein